MISIPETDDKHSNWAEFYVRKCAREAVQQFALYLCTSWILCATRDLYGKDSIIHFIQVAAALRILNAVEHIYYDPRSP